MSRKAFPVTVLGAIAAAMAFALFPSLLGDRNDDAAQVRHPLKEVGRTHAQPLVVEDGQAEIADFADWISEYLAAGQRERAALVDEGLVAARSRRAAMRELIETDPAAAIAVTPDRETRAQLPAAILAELESVVSGTGEIFAMCSTGGPHECHELHGARVGNERFVAHLFGRRETIHEARETSVYGVALDGHLAVWDSPVRVVTEQDDGTLIVEVRGERQTLGSFAEAYALEKSLYQEELRVALEADSSPQVDDDAEESSATTGSKRFLVLQVDFPDLPGALVEHDEALTFFDAVSSFYDENSYGKLSIDFTISEGAVRLPFTVAEYVATRGPQGLADDALDLVADRYDADAFDCVVFVFANIAPASPGNFYWAGLGGGGRVWINGSLRKDVVCHEIGHHFGVGHAGSWAPDDQNPLSASGRRIAYGDPADVMAMTADGIPGHFNPAFKRRLGWLPDHAVTDVRESGVYRIWRYDDGDARVDRPVALKLFRGQRDLWVSFRQQSFSHLPAYATGATVLRADLDAYRVEILDVNTPGFTTNDSPLQPGQVLDDSNYGVQIRALERSGTGSDEYMDFEVTLTPPPHNILVDYGRSSPVVSEDTFGVSRFSSGSWMSLALLDDNRVRFGGIAVYPALADLPTELELASEVDASSDQYGLNAAVSADGRAFVWGANQVVMDNLPTSITDAREVSVSGGHAAILDVRGKVSTFGRINVATTEPGDVVQVVSNASDSFYLHRDGSVSSTRAFPEGGLASFKDVVSIAVSDHHLLGLRLDGTVTAYAWDGNVHGEASTPGDLENVRQIAADNFISAALTEDGRLVRWGEARPTNPMPLLPIAAMDVRDYHSLVLLHETVPHFTLQPVPAAAETAGEIRMTAFATGATALSYRWEMREHAGADWIALIDDMRFAGTHTSSLLISASQAVIAGSEFRCVATDAKGDSSSSRPAALIPSEVSTPKISGTSRIEAGGKLVLEVDFNAAGSIQWYRNGIAIDGANAATLVISAAQEDAAGEYSVIATTSFGVFKSSATFTVAVDPAPVAAAPETGRLINMSTRAVVGTGERALISGFVVAGEGARDVLVRAVGEGLLDHGVENVLQDPALTLSHRDGSVLAANDDWAAAVSLTHLSDAMTMAGAFDLDPASRDAAVALAIKPGPYTASVAPSGSTGVALVEVFDNGEGAQSHFSNMSARGFAGTGSEVLIAGFAIEGGALQVLIRAVGHGLKGFGVDGVLADPSLTIYSGNEPLYFNQSWEEQQLEIDAASLRVGAFPLSAPEDAGILITLDPGLYSVHVHGAGDTRGVALVEIYDAR